VSAGDLVKSRVTVTTVDLSSRPRLNQHSARRRTHYPQEWHVVPKTTDEVLNERMAAITHQIQVLELQETGNEQNCQAMKLCEDPQKSAARRLERHRLLEEAGRQRRQLECELEKKCGEAGEERMPAAR
jgi:hypothetical protein